MLDNDIRVNTQNPLIDNNIKQKIKAEQVQPLHTIDHTKVTKTTKDEGNNKSNSNLFNYNPESVFAKFIKSLNTSPVFAENARKMLMNRQFINNNIKNNPVLSTLFETFIRSIAMNNKEIIDFLKFQQNNYTKFSGEFFNKLRDILKDNINNEDFKMILRNFLRSYDSFVSMEDTYKSIDSTLNNISFNLPAVLKEPFQNLTNKLVYDNNVNNLNFNLDLLKNDIIPYLGRYISKMNDFGIVREYTSVLINNIVRLEASSREVFSLDLDNLFDYIKYSLNYSEEEIENLKLSLINNYETAASTKNEVMDSFLDLIKKGINESDNVVNKGLMEEMVESLLFDRNVHIPLSHLILPLNYNGMFMFSEVWVSKFNDNIETDKKNNKYKESYKIFITFEIQNIGYFETVLIYTENNLSIDLLIPNSLTASINKISDDLKNIISKNILVSKINVSECNKKRRFNEVFNNLSERKVGVDVII